LDILNKVRVGNLKPVAFLGDSFARLREFPAGARRNAGYQLYRIQCGLEPDDWKPMRAIGRGVCEIRVRHAGGAFRVIYFAMLADTVYVLHAFQKQTSATSKRDLDSAAERMRGVTRTR
jgi:phage-related protein